MQRFCNYLNVLLLITGIQVLSFSEVYSLNPNMKHSKQYDTIYINGDINIDNRDSLIISPGTVMMFTGYFSINVSGKIIAAGTPTDSIIFTVADTLGFSNINIGAGGWNGIRFEDTPAQNDSSLFSYCRFEYGKATGDSANYFGGAIRMVRYHSVRISNSSFANNNAYLRGGAIHAYKSNPVIEHSVFEDNFAGNDTPDVFGYGGGISYYASNPTIKFCTFRNNSSTGFGGGLVFDYSNPEILNCVFTENFSGLGGAMGFLRSVTNRTIANLLIYNNASEFFGGGIAISDSDPKFSNLTIVNNQSSMGGGYYCNNGATPDIYNSIIWGNNSGSAGGYLGSQVWIWDIISTPGFYNCNVQYGTEQFGGSTFIGVYENNIDADPLFSDPAIKDFKLTMDSPCINTGTSDTTGLLLPAFDFAMMPRINHGVIDMGAYEYYGTFPGVIPGDADCDGIVNILDIITIANHIIGLNPEPFCFENADLNFDASIDLLDLIGTTSIILQ